VTTSVTIRPFDQRNLAAIIAIAILWLASTTAWAQAPTTTTPPTASKPPYEVTGFRGARFGMDEAQVRAAIQKEFPVKPDDIKVTPNAMERTTALVVSLALLEPAPGPATVVYILGYKSKQLIQVNVVWAQPDGPAKPDSAAYLVAGAQLANYFSGFSWREGKVTVTAPAGPNALLVFGAEDAKTGSVQVVAQGVAFERKPDGRVEAVPQAGTAISLRVSYIANLATPDIFRLEPGRF